MASNLEYCEVDCEVVAKRRAGNRELLEGYHWLKVPEHSLHRRESTELCRAYWVLNFNYLDSILVGLIAVQLD